MLTNDIYIFSIIISIQRKSYWLFILISGEITEIDK